MPEKWNAPLLDQLDVLKKQVVVDAYIGENHTNSGAKLSQHPSAFSIFFPKNDTFLINDVIPKFFYNDAPNATLFTRVAKWNDMILSLLKNDTTPLSNKES
jgi:hypothetical protein